MPIDPLTGMALIGGGSQMLNMGIDWANTSNMNKKNREFAERQQRRQEAFTWDMWNKTNEYNSPQAQMDRYRQAGLNPHLIYGKGTPGNASTSAAPTQAQFKYQKPQIELPQMISLYQDWSLRDAQIRNLNLEATRIMEDTAYKAALAGLTSGKRDIMQDTWETQAEAYRLRNLHMAARIYEINQKAGLTEAQKNWNIKRYNIYSRTGVDINRDNIGTRILQKIGEAIEKRLKYGKLPF